MSENNPIEDAKIDESSDTIETSIESNTEANIDKEEVSFEELDLKENNIFFLNINKKLRAFYREEEYKNKNENNESKEITIALKKLKKLSKLNEKFDNIILPELEKYEIISESWKKLAINIKNIDLYFSETDIAKIEKEFLLIENWVNPENAQKIIDTKDLTFNDKVQKIFTNLESLKERKTVLKELIDEKLNESEEFVEINLQMDELKEELKNVKESTIPEDMEKTMKEIKEEDKEEKEILMEFLEFSAENGKINEVEVLNKNWIKFKPKMNFSLQKVKEEK